jgi:hypothetical protein
MTEGDLKERSHFRRHAMLGIPVKGYFPSNPEQLLLNDALYEYMREGTKLPSWFANAHTDPEEFENEHPGVLRRLAALTAIPLTTEAEEMRRSWNDYKEWCFDSCGELWEDDNRSPRERLQEFFKEEEIEFEWNALREAFDEGGGDD